jgi:hypothetical protein
LKYLLPRLGQFLSEAPYFILLRGNGGVLQGGLCEQVLVGIVGLGGAGAVGGLDEVAHDITINSF